MRQGTCAIVLLAVVVVAACRTQADVPAPATQVYRCDDGLRFVAQFEPQRAWLFLQERTVSLPQVSSGSGMHYTDGSVTFRGQRNDASLEAEGRSRTRCVAVPEEAEWEEAKLRGVDFRATGRDATWSLEITHRQQIVFALDGGRARHVFVNPVPVPAQGDGRSYEARSGADRIRIVFDRGDCQLAVAGPVFETAVTVVLNDRTYEGCGMRLR